MNKYLYSIFVIIIILSLSACSASTSPAEENSTLPTLSIGVMSAVDMLPIYIADKNGYFLDQGVKVQIEVFKSFKDRDAALQAGELDGIIGDLVAISIYQNAGLDMVVTGLTDGVFSLVAGKDSGLESIHDFDGEKVAISENTVIEYTLDQLLLANGIEASRIEKVVIPPLPTRLEMLNAGEVAASLMPNPFSDAAIAAGATMLLQITSEKDDYISVTAFENKVIKEKPDAIKAFYRAYNQAVDYLNTHDLSDYEDDVIDVVGYPETMKGQTSVPVFKKNTLPSVELVEKVFAWSKEKGLLTIDIDPASVLNPIGIH